MPAGGERRGRPLSLARPPYVSVLRLLGDDGVFHVVAPAAHPAVRVGRDDAWLTGPRLGRLLIAKHRGLFPRHALVAPATPRYALCWRAAGVRRGDYMREL